MFCMCRGKRKLTFTRVGDINEVHTLVRFVVFLLCLRVSKAYTEPCIFLGFTYDLLKGALAKICFDGNEVLPGDDTPVGFGERFVARRFLARSWVDRLEDPLRRIFSLVLHIVVG